MILNKLVTAAVCVIFVSCTGKENKTVERNASKQENAVEPPLETAPLPGSTSGARIGVGQFLGLEALSQTEIDATIANLKSLSDSSTLSGLPAGFKGTANKADVNLIYPRPDGAAANQTQVFIAFVNGVPNILPSVLDKNYSLIGLTSGSKYSVVLALISLTSDELTRLTDIFRSIKLSNRTLQKYLDDQKVPPVVPTPVPELAIFNSATAFTLSGVSSNGVQSLEHKIYVDPGKDLVDKVAKVSCAVSFGKASLSGPLQSCQFVRQGDQIELTLPPAITSTKHEYANFHVELIDGKSGKSAVKKLGLFLTSSVRGLSACAKEPAFLANPDVVLSHPALAGVASHSFDNSKTNLDVDISIHSNLGILLEKQSLRTTYKRITYKGKDFIVVYKAFPGFVATNFNTAMTHSDMCLVTDESHRYGRFGKIKERYQAYVINASGTVIGVQPNGNTVRQITNVANGSLKSIVFGDGAPKSKDLACQPIVPNYGFRAVAPVCLDLN